MLNLLNDGSYLTDIPETFSGLKCVKSLGYVFLLLSLAFEAYIKGVVAFRIQRFFF